jgi:hypothetical protein
MQDFKLTDANSSNLRFNSVIGTDTVLVSHAPDPLLDLPYYQYLNELECRVVLINSKDNILLHLMIETFDLDIDTYTDPSRGLISNLKDRWGITTGVEDLSRFFRFQILYNHGKIVNEWRQPVTDQWDHFLGDRKSFKRFYTKFGSYGIKWLQDQKKDNNLLWTGSSSSFVRKNFDLDLFLKYHKLMPNSELEEQISHIFDKKDG